jgi:hypothetical protein
VDKLGKRVESDSDYFASRASEEALSATAGGPAVVIFRTARVAVENGVITATFGDGKRNEFYLRAMAGNVEYRRIARWAGYGDDWQRYGIEHELTHHWLADRLAWRWSWSLHEDLPQPWPEHIAWEEHVVNQLQRQMMTGEPDEFCVLEGLFGDSLGERMDALRRAVERAQAQLDLTATATAAKSGADVSNGRKTELSR